jgi:hypothetical protein
MKLSTQLQTHQSILCIMLGHGQSSKHLHLKISRFQKLRSDSKVTWAHII